MMKRRDFLSLAGAICLKPVISEVSPLIMRKAGSGSSFYRIGHRNGRWWLITPQNKYEWSIGLNHLDSASLRFEECNDLWESRYNNSMPVWLRKVKSDMKSWGFNCLGWDQEVVIIKPGLHRHSRSLTYEEYQWLDMPYFHLLPFIESHQWECETRLPDIKGGAFKEWCDYVARDECARFKGDPKLIGYFFTDCPAWIHSNSGNFWKAPIFDPEMEKSEAGRKEISETAGIYYKTITEAIKRYDPDHLICGDRYEANAPISMEVIYAALPYVDIFSFQCFSPPDQLSAKMSYWASVIKKPVLVADSAFRQGHDNKWPPDRDLVQDDILYNEALLKLRNIPECIGFHLCGAYIKNNARRYGLIDRTEAEEKTTAGIKQANLNQIQWYNDLNEQ